MHEPTPRADSGVRWALDRVRVCPEGGQCVVLDMETIAERFPVFADLSNPTYAIREDCLRAVLALGAAFGAAETLDEASGCKPVEDAPPLPRATLAVRVLAVAHSGSTNVTTGVVSRAPTDEAPSFGGGSAPAKTFYTGAPIAEFQVPAASGGNGAVSCTASGLPGSLVYAADGAGSCPGTEPREVCGTPTTATSAAQTATITAQDADANRAAGDQGTLTFQASALAKPTLAASPAAANPAPFPAPPPVV